MAVAGIAAGGMGPAAKHPPARPPVWPPGLLGALHPPAVGVHLVARAGLHEVGPVAAADDVYGPRPRVAYPVVARPTEEDVGLDYFSGGPGDDAISVPGFGPGPPELYEESDAISCGPGLDRVEAHPLDLVAADCETVKRVPGPF